MRNKKLAKASLFFFALLAAISFFYKYSVEKAGPEKIYLVWFCNPESMWEGDWIRELLASKEYEIEEVIVTDKKVYLDHAIYVTNLARNRKDLKDFFQDLHKRRYKFGIIHLSDEGYQDSLKSYKYAGFVLRNYWSKKLAKNPKVLQIPLGYKSKFWADRETQETKKASERKYLASFAGQITKSTRMEMAENMKKLGNFFLYETPAFAAASALPVNEYRDLLIDSVFSPCPRGFSNIDTFRLCEALEAGCIPIVEKGPNDYYAHLFDKEYPFLAIDSWDEVPVLLNSQFLNDPELIEKKQRECMDWWAKKKNELRSKIAYLIRTSL